MKRFFTPIRLFAAVGVLATAALIYSFGFSGDDDKDKKKRKIEKRIEIVEENGEKKVTITTIEDGKKKVETYTGAEAEAYIMKQDMQHGNMRMSFDFNFDTLMGKNSFDFRMNGFGEEFEKEMQEMLKELEKSGSQLKLDLESLFKSFDTSFSKNNFRIYSFDFDNDMKQLDSLLNGSFNFDFQFDDEEDNASGEKKPKRKHIVIAHSVVMEDMDKNKGADVKDMSISDLSFYPNPNSGNFTLRYKSESMDMITINVTDMAGKSVYNERISATGTVIRNIELENPAGTYILNLTQGKKQVIKKLIIE